MTVSWIETDMGIEITLNTDHALTLVHYFATTVQPPINSHLLNSHPYQVASNNPDEGFSIVSTSIKQPTVPFKQPLYKGKMLSFHFSFGEKKINLS